jgi:PAS domain S-box-containing protein
LVNRAPFKPVVMLNEERTAPVESYENHYFAVINDHGVIHYANTELVKCIHIENKKPRNGVFFNFLSSVCSNNLKEALQMAGFAAHPAYLKMNLLNGSVHKAAWHITRLKSASKQPLYICIGSETNNEKPTNTERAAELANTPAFGILVHDENGKVIDANDRAATMLNTNPESLNENAQLTGLWHRLKIVTSPVSFEKPHPMNTAISVNMHEQIVQINPGCPKSKWLRFKSFPLFDDTQSVPFSIVTLITELTPQEARKKYEKELFQKEFLNITSAMTWLIDAENEHLIFGNPAFLRFLGMNEIDLHKKALDVIPSFFTAIFEHEHRQVLATGIAHKKIYKVPLADGTNSYYQVNIFQVPNNLNKQLIGGEAFDITFGYNLHEEIARANERLIRLTQVTSEAIWEWDLQTNQIFRNKPLQELIGFNEGQMEGLSWWFNRIHPEDRERIEFSIKNTLHNKLSSWHGEYRFQYADGVYRTVRDRGFVVYEKDIPVKMIGSILDVTQIKELEHQLIREKIKHQQELAKSIIDAREKERTKLGQELHDNVNQLLTVSKLYLGLLKPTDPEKQLIVERIMESLTGAINDIQTISREMVLPKLKEKTLPDSIDHLVTDVKMTGRFDIQFIYDCPYNDDLSEGKKIAVYRILQEQLKNIIQYSQANKVTIQLKSDKRVIELIITDDGIGFDPLKKTKGIGLRNIYDRTQLYNGRVKLIAAPGKGCQLKVSIPKK